MIRINHGVSINIGFNGERQGQPCGLSAPAGGFFSTVSDQFGTPIFVSGSRCPSFQINGAR
jgi:hypothetical protein